MATHHDEKIISANGIEICTDAFGDPEHSAILLIMGASASMLLWEEQFCQQLADAGRFVIRFDNRDTGRTTSMPLGEPNYTLQDMADDAVAVLDDYGIDKAHICGASMGGMITQLVGLNHPDRALSLIPIMSTPDPAAVTDPMEGKESTVALSPPNEDILVAAAAGATLDHSDREAVLENRVAMFRILSGSAHPYDENSRRELFGREIDRAVNFASSNNHALIVGASERWYDRLSTISLPTLVIHGTEDPILPFDHGQALAAAIPGAKLLTLEGAGHDMPEAEYDNIVSSIIEITS